MMTKIMISFVAFLMGLGIFEANVAEIEEITSSTLEVEIMEEKLMEEESTLESDESEAYKAYLEELNGVGPKEFVDATVHLDAKSKVSDDSKSNTGTKSSTSSTKTPNAEDVDALGKRSASLEKEEKDPITIKEKEVVLAVVDHAPFGALLRKHVDAKGNVNYAGFKKDQAKLEAYIKTLQANPVTSSQSKNERLSYWINVYNAYTIKLILDNYPIKSIKEIENGKPWDKLFITLGNTTYSLNDVENNIIRKRFTEPRIHFAVNCAAASCPPLLNDAFYPNKLLDQLDERTRSFLKNRSYNNLEEGKLQISKIFDWYGSDFGDIKSFLGPYVSFDVRNASVEFKEYDWTLNKQ